MRHFGTAFLFILAISLSAIAGPVTPVESLAEESANPHFGSKLLMDAGLAHDAGLHLGWSKQITNLSTSAPSIEFMGSPEICVEEPRGPVVAAPEPATMLLLGSGLVGIGGLVRKARKNHNQPNF